LALSCTTPSTTLTASGGGTYAWTGGTTGATLAVTTAGTFTVTVTSPNGCTATSSATTTLDNIPPDAPSASAIQPTCTTTTGSISISTSAAMYSFDNGATYGTSSTLGALAAGNYLIKIKNAAGCESPATTVVINAAPTPPTVAFAGTATVCQGASTNLTVTITGGTSPYTVVYSGGTLNSYVSGTNIPVTPAATTTYSLTSVTDAAGCPASLTGSGSPIVTVKGIAALTVGTSETLNRDCDVNGWTYYTNAATNMAFAINWAPDGTLSTANAAAKNNAAVIIGLNSNYTTGNVAPNRVYAMKRFWNVNNAGIFDEPVQVRFFYDPSEKAAVVGVPGANSFNWIKTNGTPFDPAVNLTPSAVTGLNVISGTNGTQFGITYVEFANVSSFSGGTGVTLESSVLAVDFQSVNAQAKGNANVITWTTATEKEVKEFVVERSIDNKTWTVISTHTAIGGVSPASYTANDNAPLDLSYYRIRSIENTGKGQLSKVVAVKRNSNKLLLVAVSPNPTSDGVNIDFSVGKIGKVVVTVTDLMGRIIAVETYKTAEGANTAHLDLSKAAQGTYILSINDGETVANQRIIKY
jgi:Secretion system C-terminal sorting domain